MQTTRTKFSKFEINHRDIFHTNHIKIKIFVSSIRAIVTKGFAINIRVRNNYFHDKIYFSIF